MFGAIIFMLIRFAPFIAALPIVASLSAAAQAPDIVPSRIVRVVEFADAGNTYRVDVESGKVTKARLSDVVPVPPGPAPTPQPTPTPNPPSPVAGKPAWFVMFVSQSRADRQWPESEELRNAIAETGAQFRAFHAAEAKVDELRYRKFIAELGAPCIVVVDTDRKVMFARKLASLEDTMRAVKELK